MFRSLDAYGNLGSFTQVCPSQGVTYNVLAKYWYHIGGNIYHSYFNFGTNYQYLLTIKGELNLGYMDSVETVKTDSNNSHVDSYKITKVPTELDDSGNVSKVIVKQVECLKDKKLL